MTIINFANKWELIRDKKNRDKFFVRLKKIGEKHWSGKKKSGKNFVTCKIFSHFSPTFFSPIRYMHYQNVYGHQTWHGLLSIKSHDTLA